MGILRNGAVRSMAAAILLVTGSAGMYGEGQATGPLKLGLLLNFSEGSTGRAADRKRAFDLAVEHLNAGGGVLGHPVEVAVGARPGTRSRRWRKHDVWWRTRTSMPWWARAPAPTRCRSPNR